MTIDIKKAFETQQAFVTKDEKDEDECVTGETEFNEPPPGGRGALDVEMLDVYV